MMPPSTATVAPAAAVGFQFNKSASSVYADVFFFNIRSSHSPVIPPPVDVAAVAAVDDDACDYNAAACHQLPSAKAICLPSIISSHVVLQFVLQTARDRPAHLIQVGGGAEDMRRKWGIRSFLC